MLKNGLKLAFAFGYSFLLEKQESSGVAAMQVSHYLLPGLDRILFIHLQYLKIMGENL